MCEKVAWFQFRLFSVPFFSCFYFVCWLMPNLPSRYTVSPTLLRPFLAVFRVLVGFIVMSARWDLLQSRDMHAICQCMCISCMLSLTCLSSSTFCVFFGFFGLFFWVFISGWASTERWKSIPLRLADTLSLFQSSTLFFFFFLLFFSFPAMWGGGLAIAMYRTHFQRWVHTYIHTRWIRMIANPVLFVARRALHISWISDHGGVIISIFALTTVTSSLPNAWCCWRWLMICVWWGYIDLYAPPANRWYPFLHGLSGFVFS